MLRIISLIASATEIVSALGFADSLVGRSHECDFPLQVTRLPVCTGPKFDVHGSSAEIDRRVKDVLREGLSVYNVNAELLRELRPDLIVTQSQCDVCAVSDKDVERAVCSWVESAPRVVSLTAEDLGGLWTDIERVAHSLGAQRQAAEVLAQLRGKVAKLSERAAALPERPTVACIEWLEPLMAAGNWVPELVQLAGGDSLFGAAGKHAPWLSWEQLSAADPDVVVLMPCGWDVARTLLEMPVLTSRPEWQRLKAVRERRVFLTDGNQYFNRPGPRLVESLEILAEILHPEAFDFGHEGRGWQRFTA